MTETCIKVYLAGGTAAGARTLQIVGRMVEEVLAGKAEIEVIDVLANPELAESADVLATPTIDCVMPLPHRRVVGVPDTSAQLANALILFPARPESS